MYTRKGGGLSWPPPIVPRQWADCAARTALPYWQGMPIEKRRSPRTNVAKKLQVTYVDEQGQERYEAVAAQDVSPTGCCVLLKFRCRPRTVVLLSLTAALSGSATIRYQNPTPRGFVTGLEFLGGLQLPAAGLS